MKRVLFIAYLFPPIANSGTRRSLSFVNHLPDHGWQPTVLTVADPLERDCDPSLLTEVRSGTRVERAPLGSDVAARLIARWTTLPSFRQRVAGGLAWRLAKLFDVPDEAASWYPMAVGKGVELHRELGFDVVYASGSPWTSFLVAQAISRKTGCPYVLDYRDGWAPSGTVAWEAQRRLQLLTGPYLERRAAKRASAVVTVTPTLVPVVCKTSGNEQVHLITNGFEPDDFITDAVRIDDGMVRVAYTGVWRSGYGPDALYRAVRRLKDAGSPFLHRLKVITAGYPPGPAQAHGVEDIVEELGRVSHRRAVDIMCTADLLYLPVSDGFYANAALPGKLFEYLGSATPILAAVPSDSDTAKVLESVGGYARIDPGDDAALARVLEKHCSGELTELIRPRSAEKLRGYTRAATTEALAKVFDGVVTGRSGKAGG